MRVGLRINQLHIHPHLVVCFLDTAFQNVRDPKLLCNVWQIFRRTLEMLLLAGRGEQTRNPAVGDEKVECNDRLKRGKAACHEKVGAAVGRADFTKGPRLVRPDVIARVPDLFANFS